MTFKSSTIAISILWLSIAGDGFAAGDQPANDQADDAGGRSNAEVAKQAYDNEDAKPTENWFGCPPVAKDDESMAEADDDCEPVSNEDAAGNDKDVADSES